MREFISKINDYKLKSDEEILSFLYTFWGLETNEKELKLIGSYEKSDRVDKNGKEYGFFTDVRSLKGDILYYPFRLGLVKIWVEHKTVLQQSDFLLFKAKLNYKNKDLSDRDIIK